MSESAKVRLVRCPKCENLLPELTDYSVYQCGGCGAVLRANNKNGELDEFVDKSEEEVVVKPENVDVSEKRMMNVSNDGSGYDVKSNISSLSRAERRRASLMNETDDWGTVDERVVYKNEVDGQSRENMTKEFENFDSLNGKEMEARIPERVLEWRSRERSDSEVLPRVRRVDLEGMRYSSSINPEEGPSGYCSSSNYEYGKPSSRNDVEGFNQADYPVDDRAELLRKFNELKEQLSRFDNVSEKPKETVSLERRIDRHEGHGNLSENSKGTVSLERRMVHREGYGNLSENPNGTVSLERRMAHHEGYGNLSENPNGTVSLERRMARDEGYGNSYDWFPEGSTRIMNRASAQNPVSDDRPPNMNRYNMATPPMNGHDMLGGGFYPPRNHIQEYGGPLRSQVLRRDPYQAPAPFQQQPSHARFPGRYMDNEMPPADPYRSYPPQINPHHPSCNCYHCCNADQMLSRAPPTAFGDKRFSVIPQNTMFYHHENAGSFGQRDYNPRNANTLPSKPQSFQLQMSRSGDLNSDVGGYARRRPPRVQLSGQQCRPVAGGAPFFTCYNCFELLQLPKNVLHRGKRQKKMKCGACSTVMVFSVAGNKLAVSIDERLEKISDKIGQQHRVILNEGNLYADGHTNHPSMTFSSEDYDTARYDFHAMDQELGSLSTGHGSSIKSAELRSLRSTHSCSSREEDNLVNSTGRMEKSDSAELPMKGKSSPPPAGSPLQEYFDYSSKYHVENRLDNGNRSARSDSEKLMQKRTTSRQNSTKGVVVATEMDIPSNEYANTGTSFESGESSRDGDSLKSSKAGESFFAGIIKKSFKEFSRSNSSEQEKANTTVNGHLVPNRLIKKAEKISGPIQPGQYWYDFRAGFWGVMGGPCLGIIPPFIEEFNYPLPENCAGGNTGVFVNGRELHPKDLKLLGSRGLPTERDRSYIIEISGRVLDEDTGEELESLGKLAPTVEKSKRGFGMKVPKVAAQPA